MGRKEGEREGGGREDRETESWKEVGTGVRVGRHRRATEQEVQGDPRSGSWETLREHANKRCK